MSILYNAMFRDLPSELSAELLCKWLDLRTLVQLDSAACNHENRLAFLQLLASSHCVFASKVKFDGKEVVNWFRSRNLQISSLAASAYFPELVKYSRSHFASIRHMTCLVSQAVKVVGMYFRNLVSLTYCNSIAVSEMSDMLWWNVNLQELRLEGLHGVNAEHFDALRLPQLRVLSLARSSCGDELLGVIIRTTKVLQKIDIGNCISVSDQGVIAVAQSCPQLQSFGLRYLEISDGALLQLTQLCPCLTSVDVSANTVITDLGVRVLAKNLSKLRRINICDCDNLTDASMEHLIQYSFSTLQELHATGLPEVRVDVCIALLQKCPHMHSLALDCDLVPHCAEAVPYMCHLQKLAIYSLLSDEALSLIAKHCKKLQQLGIFSTHVCTTDNTAPEARVMYRADDYANWEDHLYTAKGLLALMDGLPLLRVLGVNDLELEDGELTSFAQSVWRRLRPQLVFGNDSDHLVFDVLSE